MATTTKIALDYKVRDINQADFGRKEIQMAEVEMPGLMANTLARSPSRARASPARCT
jgi:S-adenosylhomocysteine hydrolase